MPGQRRVKSDIVNFYRWSTTLVRHRHSVIMDSPVPLVTAVPFVLSYALFTNVLLISIQLENLNRTIQVLMLTVNMVNTVQIMLL
jgi:hypothetical protein